MANEVVINVKANTDKANKGLKGFGDRLSAVSRKAGIAATAIGALGAVAIKSFVGAAMEQQRAVSTLASTVENTGVSFDTVKQKILDTTAALQAKTNFGDEEQIRTLTILTTILGDSEKALAALPAVMDASSASGLKMESVAKTMGKALAGQVHQAESVGVIFDKTSGFGERLNQVLGKVGGAAEANVDPFTQLSNDMGDLKETIGAALIPILLPLVQWARDMVKRIQEMNPAFVKFTAIALAVATAVGLIAGPILFFISLLPAIVSGLSIVGTALAVLTGPVALVVAAVVGLALAFKNNLFGIRDLATSLFNNIMEIIGKVVEWLVGKINGMIDVVNRIGGIFGKEIPYVEVMADKLLDLGKGAVDATKSFVGLGEASAQTTNAMIEDNNKLNAEMKWPSVPAAPATPAFSGGGGGLGGGAGVGGVGGGGEKATGWWDYDTHSKAYTGMQVMNEANLASQQGRAMNFGFGDVSMGTAMMMVNMGFRIDNAGRMYAVHLGGGITDFVGES